MSLLDRLLPYNPFAKFFQRADQKEIAKDEQEMKNAQGISEIEAQWNTIFNATQYQYSSDMAGIIYTGVMWDQYFGTKAGRIFKYREMSFYPEISDALDKICDEAISPDSTGNIVSLEFKKEFPSHIEKQIRDIWNYLITDVYAINERGWDMFRKWLVDSEIYIELILNNEGNNMVGVKILPPHTMIPIYEDDKIKGYMQTVAGGVSQMGITQGTGSVVLDKANSVTFAKNQVAYVNYGIYGENWLDVRGYLETAIRTFNQLKNLEDALIIYRLVRSPERRVWNVWTGRMPKGKAEEYMKSLIQLYKKRIIYDPDTGAMNASQNVQSLTEDYWFAKTEGGEGTTVETIGGGMTLGELDDVKYFLEKLYKTLKLPRSRWDDTAGTMYSSGKSGEILREEINFSNFVQRLQRRFAYILTDPFLTLLRLKGIDEKYINESFYSVKFVQSNLFKKYREMELTEARFGILANMSEYIYNKNDNPKGMFDAEFVLRNYFLMTDEEWEQNQELLARTKGGDVGTGEAVPGEVGGLGGTELGGLGGLGGGTELGGGGGLGGATPEIGGPAAAPVTPATPEVGGVTPAAPAGGELMPPTAVAPESLSFSDVKKAGELFTTWMNDDKSIRDKYNNGDGFINKSNVV